METAISRLVDRDAALVRLFDPPYSPQERYVGYISSYGAGFRENGGQYTHGALWLAMSCFRLGMAERGYELLRLLLPQSRELRRYQAEPSCWRRMSTPRRDMRARRAGHGIQARQAGFSAW